MSLTADLNVTDALAPAAIPDVPIYRLTVAQYHAMLAAGVLSEDDPVELLEGWLVPKMTKHKPHSLTTRRVRQALEGIVPAGWSVDSQEPITMEQSEPEPDVFVARQEAADDPSRHPSAHEVCLIVEVAETSLQTDQGSKKRLYARAGIPVYWIVNLPSRQIEVYTDPTGPAAEPDYRGHRDYRAGDLLPVLIAGVEAGSLDVAALLP
jgi:Uma2 family endonuclease